MDSHQQLSKLDLFSNIAQYLMKTSSIDNVYGEILRSTDAKLKTLLNSPYNIR